MDVTLDMKLVRESNIIHNLIDNEVVILSISTEQYFYLNEIGSKIWDLLEEPISVRQLIYELMDIFDVSYAKCKVETVSYLHELIDLKVITQAK
jgi:hypothetical protein